MSAAIEAAIIPNNLHFIWFGSRLPDFAHIAIRSALRANPGARATLWHDATLEKSAELRMLMTQGLSLSLIRPRELFAELAARNPELNTERLKSLYRRLRQPAGRANMIRMLALYLRGGIYLDTDTLTIKDFSPLRFDGAFCGEESILWPSGASRLNPRLLALGELRRLCSYLPGGHRLHRHMLKGYTRAANNAVMGACAGHPLILAMLERAATLPEREWTRRFRLGTHLLQECLKAYRSPATSRQASMRILPPSHFYPTGPEISLHYFRRVSSPDVVARELVSPETYVVHWYASVANLDKLDYDHIRHSAHRDVYSYLCSKHVAHERLAAHVPASRQPVNAGVLAA